MSERKDGMEREAREWLRDQAEDQRFRGDFRPDHVKSLVALLARCANEARLDEQSNHNMVTPRAWRERIAELKAAAEPVPPPKPAREGG